MGNLIDVQSITTQVEVHLTEDEKKRLELALMVTVDEFLSQLPPPKGGGLRGELMNC